MSDIVERLHKCDLTLHDLIICDEAADEIEALRAENARLRGAVMEAQRKVPLGELHDPHWWFLEEALATKEQS